MLPTPMLPRMRNILTLNLERNPLGDTAVNKLVETWVLRPEQSGVPALSREPSHKSGLAQQKLILFHRSSFCSTGPPSVQQDLLLFNRTSFCSTEAPLVQQELLLRNGRYFC